MHPRFCFGSLLVLAAVCVLNTRAASDTTADADWAALEATFKSSEPRPPAGHPEDELAWSLRKVKRNLVAGDQFFAQHPEAPRRWDALLEMTNGFDSWIGYAIKAPADRKVTDTVMDEAERAKWRARLDELCAAAVQAPDISDRIRAYFDARPFRRLVASVYDEKTPASIAATKTEFARLAAKYPDTDTMGHYAKSYLRAVEETGATRDEVLKEWRALAQIGNEVVRKTATVQIQLLTESMKIAFTAADGHEVDLAKLRGKVVLVDFWATWCGPCIAELPNVKKVFAAYHDKGFEVVGIALENGKLTPKDTPEQTATKLVTAKKVLTDFTAKNEMPWPQHFDGKYWKNDISTSFAITSIPAMFLLDQDGKVVSTNARGEKLEQEVKRLLKL